MNVPDLLDLKQLDDKSFEVVQPATSAEGRDVVFSGQLIGQTIAASARGSETKHVRSIHSVFARAGSYLQPIVLEVDVMHSGRTWASDTVSATQNGRLLCRSLVLLNTIDPDLIRHGPPAPTNIPSASDLVGEQALAFPGAELRFVPGEGTDRSVPVEMAWHRFDRPVDSVWVSQAVVSWATCGRIIGLAMRPHRESVRVEDAHVSLSTGVIAHTLHFLEPFDVSEWLLIVTEATQAANGRVYGHGSIFTSDGRLVAAFQQDAMAKFAEAPLDPRRSM